MFDALHDASLSQVALLALVALYLSTWIHEVGHALAGRLAGFRITSLGTGFGRPILRIPLGETVLFISPRRLFQGLTTSVRDRWPTSRRARAFLIAGGFGANLLACAAAFLGLLLVKTPPLPLVLFALVNAAIALFALLPASILLPGASLKTDASQLIGLFRRSRRGADPLARIESSRRFVAFLTAIRDPYGEYHHRIHLASSLSSLGNHEGALDVLDPVREDLYPQASHMGALLRVVRGTARLGAEEDVEAGVEDLRAADAFFRSIDAPDMGPHINQLLARLALDRGRLEEARELLGERNDAPPDPAENLLRAEIALEDGLPQEALDLLREDSLPRGEDGLLARALLAQAEQGLERPEKALEHLESAAKRVANHLAVLGRENDREAYRHKHRRAIRLYPQILRKLGREDEADAFEENAANAMSGPPARRGFLSIPALSSVACAAAAVALLAWQAERIAAFEGDVTKLRWAGILAVGAVYFGVSGILQGKIRKILPLAGLFIGIATLLVLATFFGTLFITRKDLLRETQEYDRNGDGVTDKILVVERGFKKRLEEDRDFDGRPDRWVRYEEGVPVVEELDEDGDGRPDVVRRRRTPP